MSRDYQENKGGKGWGGMQARRRARKKADETGTIVEKDHMN